LALAAQGLALAAHGFAFAAQGLAFAAHGLAEVLVAGVAFAPQGFALAPHWAKAGAAPAIAIGSGTMLPAPTSMATAVAVPPMIRDFRCISSLLHWQGYDRLPRQAQRVRPEVRRPTIDQEFVTPIGKVTRTPAGAAVIDHRFTGC